MWHEFKAHLGNGLLQALLAQRVVRLDLQAGLVAVHALVVLLHEELDVPLLRPGLHIVAVQLQRLLHRPLRIIEHTLVKQANQGERHFSLIYFTIRLTSSPF